MRRGLVVAVVLCLAGSALVLLATSRVWLEYATGAAPPLPSRRFSAGGAELVPGARALALLGLAGVAALPATKGRGRQAVGLLLAAAGAGTVAVVVRALLDPLGAARGTDAFRYDVAFSGTPDLGAWPYVALLGGLVLVAAGSLVVARGRSWTALGARYDAPAAAKEPSPWDALDRGDDPTT
jgi:uncharacterized membrane protein (TIGR02234 family)